jgi:aryl-alcohol dehydrogenase-like predicted oxidoreductase
MESRQLGKSKVKVSPIILGTWAIGGWMWGGTDEHDSIAAIQTSIDHGINTLDTAAIYGMGYSEEIIGKAIKGRRDKVVIATKCGMRWDTKEGSDPWLQEDLQGKPVTIRKNSKPQSIIHECEQSLKRLGVDKIDLYQIHWPDSTTPIEESWKAMVKLKEQGKVLAIGVSNYNLDQLHEAHAIHPVDSIQPPYSLLRREIEQDILPFCQKNHIGVIVYSPLERGILTGKVTMERQFPKGDHRENHTFFLPENRKRILDALDQIKPIAQRHNATLSQIIINCTIHMPGITAAIVGARNAAQAIENAGAGGLNLSAEERRSIAKVINPNLVMQKVNI